MSLEDRQLCEAPLDSLVHVAKALFQPQDLFPDHRETKVSRLDGAGMNRSDRNLVDPVAFDAHEVVPIEQCSVARRSRLVDERTKRFRPGTVPQPRPAIGIARDRKSTRLNSSPV